MTEEQKKLADRICKKLSDHGRIIEGGWRAMELLSFWETDDGGTDVLMIDGDTIELDIDFDSFCRMIEQATENGSILTNVKSE